MVDYNIDPHVIECLNKLGAVKAKTILDYGFQPNAEDSELVYNGTNDHRCILLTGDKRTINEKEFPPCQHGGIILIKEKRPSTEKICSCIKALCQSGHRAKASHNVIHLWEGKAVIHKHEDEKEEVLLWKSMLAMRIPPNRFREITKRLVAVPKKEKDRQRAEYERKKTKQKGQPSD